MQPKCVKEAFQCIGAKDDGDNGQRQESIFDGAFDGVGDVLGGVDEVGTEYEGEEDLGELGMGEGQGPETEVGSGVGDAAEDELDGLDELVHHHVAEGLVLLRLLLHLDFGVRVLQAARPTVNKLLTGKPAARSGKMSGCRPPRSGRARVSPSTASPL